MDTEPTDTNRLKPDTVTAIAATSVAVIALVVSIWQGYETRHHNRLSVRPALMLDVDYTQDEAVESIRLRNVGTGPAIVKTFTVNVDGQPVQKVGENPWGVAIKDLTASGIRVEYYWDEPDEAIGVNENSPMLSIREEEYEKSDKKKKQMWAEAAARIGIIIEYHSIYGEEFRVEYKPIRQ